MRILLCTLPEKTIFMTMVPLAWALRTAGHDVRVASQPDFTDTITAAGLTAVPVGRNSAIWRLGAIDPDAVEDGRYGLQPPYDSALADVPSSAAEDFFDAYSGALTAWHILDNFPLIGQLVDFCRSWEPDLVLWEPITYAGGFAAEACGAAHGRVLWSLDVFGATRDQYHRLCREGATGEDPFRSWLEPYAQKYGIEFSESMVTGQFSIDQLPTALGLRSENLSYLPLQYVPYGGPSTVEPWVQRRRRPRVGVTLGLTATDRFSGYVASMQEIIDALGDLDVEVVATIADSERGKLTSVPANCTLVRYVPLQALAATCSVVVNHAGPGTLLTSALQEVPQLLIPWDFDEPALAGRVGEYGSAIVIQADVATGPEVRAAVLRLLQEPEFARRAVDLAEDIRRMPTPHDVARDVVRLAQLHAASKAGSAREVVSCEY